MTNYNSAMKWRNLLCEVRQKDVLHPSVTAKSVKTDDDPRSEFQRDYDRALFSTPVRRLQDKAQVFPLEPNDSVRTRLTHSLEVSNLARSLAERVADWMIEYDKLGEDLAVFIPPIAATCGLIHDLGNPPFGHAGEEAMRVWFEKTLGQPAGSNNRKTLKNIIDDAKPGRQLSQDFLKFDGNAQTVRLVTKLQMLADFDGLNLTLGTLSAALKYTASADNTDHGVHDREKPGYFFSEESLVKLIQRRTGTDTHRNPITYLVEACDDIVYSVVDIEDGIKKGAVTWGQVRKEISEVDDESNEIIEKAEKNIEKRIEQSGLLDNKNFSEQTRAEAQAQMFRVIAIGRHLSSVEREFKRKYDAIMSGSYDQGELVKTCDSSSLMRACKSFSRNNVFNSRDILRLESMGRRVITDLLDFFWEGARCAPYEKKSDYKTFNWKAYKLTSENYRAVFERDASSERINETGIPLEYRQLQLVADYICGMTDNFARSLHKELFNG